MYINTSNITTYVNYTLIFVSCIARKHLDIFRIKSALEKIMYIETLNIILLYLYFKQIDKTRGVKLVFFIHDPFQKSSEKKYATLL